MRTGPRFLTHGLLALTGLAIILAASSAVYAADPMPMANSAPAGLPPAAMAPPDAMVLPGSSLPAAQISSGTGSKSGNLATLEDRVTDQAKAAVKNFNSSTNDVNLEDLNTARMAIAKIEALIDIEKHLAELDKIRGDREGKTSLASSIPASALGMPANMALAVPPAQHTTSVPKMEIAQSVPSMGGGGTTVSRITGANGNYSAVVKTGGQDKTVRIGDHLSDGSSIVNITPLSISLMREGAVRQVKVDGVDAVYGHSY